MPPLPDDFTIHTAAEQWQVERVTLEAAQAHAEELAHWLNDAVR